MCGVPKSTIARFMQGCPISSENLDKLAAGLGLGAVHTAVEEVLGHGE